MADGHGKVSQQLHDSLRRFANFGIRWIAGGRALEQQIDGVFRAEALQVAIPDRGEDVEIRVSRREQDHASCTSGTQCVHIQFWVVGIVDDQQPVVTSGQECLDRKHTLFHVEGTRYCSEALLRCFVTGSIDPEDAPESAPIVSLTYVGSKSTATC